MQTILLVGVIIECLLLLGLAIFKKCTKKAFLVISAVTAACCLLVAILTPGTGSKAQRTESTIKGYVYMSAQLLKQDKPEQALLALGQITGTEGEHYGVQGLRGLAYNRSGAFSTGAFLLENTQDVRLAQLRESCLRSERAGKSLADGIIDDSLELLALTESEKARFDAELDIRYSGNSDMADENSVAILQVKSAIDHADHERAFRLAAENADSGTILDSILVSQLFLSNYNQQFLAKEDEALDNLLWEATQIQNQLNRMAAQSGTGSREYAACSAQYSLALNELFMETAKRAANYLSFRHTEQTIYELAYHLQMAQLQFFAGELAEAELHLDAIFGTRELDENQWLAVDLTLLREAFLSGLGSMENPEYDALYNQTMESLYQGVFSSVNQSEFYGYLYQYLKDLYSGISIGRPDVSDFPTVQVTISVAEDIPVSADSLLVTDTQQRVHNLTITENESHGMSVCFVLDRSGSMEGSYMESAKQAIKGFALNMEEDTQAALVSFENTASVDCPLVDSPYMVAAQVDNIYAYGGTNIAEGLLRGGEQLVDAQGNKVIILLSDGVDGYADRMGAALSKLRQQEIMVYAIGLPGCDEEYLENIATQTGGTYFPASTTASLNAVYREIRSYLNNTYTLTYQAEKPELTERTIWIEATDSMAQARRKYSADMNQEQYSQISDQQTSDLFRQNGGTLGGY